MHCEDAGNLGKQLSEQVYAYASHIYGDLIAGDIDLVEGKRIETFFKKAHDSVENFQVSSEAYNLMAVQMINLLEEMELTRLIPEGVSFNKARAGLKRNWKYSLADNHNQQRRD